jgi:hypothetical protein
MDRDQNLRALAEAARDLPDQELRRLETYAQFLKNRSLKIHGYQIKGAFPLMEAIGEASQYIDRAETRIGLKLLSVIIEIKSHPEIDDLFLPIVYFNYFEGPGHGKE